MGGDRYSNLILSKRELEVLRVAVEGREHDLKFDSYPGEQLPAEEIADELEILADLRERLPT